MPGDRATRLRAAAPLLAVLALPLVLLAPALRPGRVLSSADLLLRSYLFADARPPGFAGPANDLLGDPVQLMIPWRKLVTRELLHGRIPLWTPYAYGGSPLLGNAESAAFDPLSLPYLAAGDQPSAATVWVALLRMWVAGLGAALLARRLGASAAGVAVAGMAYGCGGFTLVWLLYPQSASAVWLPWALLAAEAMATRPGLRPAVGLALALTASAFGGHPEVAFFAAAAATLYFALRRRQLAAGDRGAWLAAAGRLAVAGALAILLTAVQTLPLLEALHEGSIVGERQASGLPSLLPRVAWETAATQAFPYLFGRPLRGEGAILGWVTNFCESNGRYVSVLGLALALLGAAATARRSAARALAVVAGLAWLYAVSVPPVSTLAGIIPGLRLLPPARADFVVLLGLALLAGIGLDAAGDFPRARRRLAIGLAGAAALALAGGAWMCLGAPGRDALAGFAARAPVIGAWLARKATGQIAADLARLAPMYGAHLLLPWAACVAAAAVWLLAASRLRPRVRGALAGAIVAADLLYFGLGFNPAIPREQAYPETAGTRTVAAMAVGGRALVIDQWLGIPANLGTYYGWADLLGYDPIGRERGETLLGLDGPYPRGEGAFPLLRYDRTDAPVLDLLGVRVVTSRRPLAAPNLELVGRVGEGYLYRNPTALPGAWAPEEVRIVPDEDRARDAMLRADFRPARVAFVEAPADTSDAAAHGTVVLARPAPGRLRLTAALEKGGVVVIGEGYDRGWRAAERGRDLRLYPCDLAVMAVELPAGHHEVELRFRPRVWRLALAMSALGAACAAAVLLLARR